MDGLPDGLSSASCICFGLLLCGGLDAETTAGLDIGLADIDDTVVVAAGACVLISSFLTVDGLVEMFGMFLVLMSISFGAIAGGFTSSFFTLESSFFSTLPGATFLPSSGSSKFNDRTVDDGFDRSLPARVSISAHF